MEKKKIRAHCSSCGPEKNADVLHEEIAHWDADPAPVFGTNTYRIIKCCGCDTIYYHTTSTNSEDIIYEDNGQGVFKEVQNEEITQYPKIPEHPLPPWTNELIAKDENLFDLLESVYKALNENLYVLAAIGIRTCFDSASEFLGIDTSLSFAKKLRKLEENGNIGAAEKEKLNSLVDAGSAAAHRGWKPGKQELMTMLQILEGFIQGNIAITDRHLELKKRTPSRK